MNVLCLHHRGAPADTPYHRWARAAGHGPPLLLASREHLEREGEQLPLAQGYRYVEALDAYDATGRLEARVLDLARDLGVRRLLACHERDLPRAARLREILDLPGPRPEAVLPSGDRLELTERARAAGLATAAARAVDSATDVLAFAARHGFPLLVRPRRTGAPGPSRLLVSRAELRGWLAEAPGPHRPGLMVETRPAGRRYQVHGLVLGGRLAWAWPADRVNRRASGLNWVTETTLSPDRPLTLALLERTGRLVAALPPGRAHVIRADFVRTPAGRLVLLDLTDGIGTDAGRGLCRTALGVDSAEALARVQLGLEPRSAGPDRPLRMAARLSLVRPAGTVRALPAPPPFPWADRFRAHVTAGLRLHGPADAADVALSAYVTAPDRTRCHTRLRLLERWITDGGITAMEPTRVALAARNQSGGRTTQ
jgi:hypothetical protein